MRLCAALLLQIFSATEQALAGSLHVQGPAHGRGVRHLDPQRAGAAQHAAAPRVLDDRPARPLARLYPQALGQGAAFERSLRLDAVVLRAAAPAVPFPADAIAPHPAEPAEDAAELALDAAARPAAAAPLDAYCASGWWAGKRQRFFPLATNSQRLRMWIDTARCLQRCETYFWTPQNGGEVALTAAREVASRNKQHPAELLCEFLR